MSFPGGRTAPAPSPAHSEAVGPGGELSVEARFAPRAPERLILRAGRRGAGFCRDLAVVSAARRRPGDAPAVPAVRPESFCMIN